MQANSSHRTKKRAEEVAERLRREGYTGVMVQRHESRHWKYNSPIVSWVVYTGCKEVID